jgi:multiple sugar transport system substrate-binding protein
VVLNKAGGGPDKDRPMILLDVVELKAMQERMVVANAGVAHYGPFVEAEIERLSETRERLGGVNLRAEEELREVEAQHGGLVSERDDLIARLSTSIVGGGAPDLFLMNYRYYGQFAAGGALEPVGPHLRGSSVLSPRDFFVTAMEPFRWDGEQMCLPQNVSSLVVYYNRDLFREHGIAEPRAGWRWNEMVQKAVALTADTDGDGNVDRYGLGVEPSIIRLAPFVWSNGGEIVDDRDEPTRLTLEALEANQVVHSFFQLRTLHGVVPTDQEVEAEDDESRFTNGRLAMLLDSRRAVPSLREAADFDWDVVSLPFFREPANVLHSDAYCMTKASGAKDEAWRFVEYALGPEGAAVVARTGRTVPSLRAVAESDAFLDPAQKPKNSRVFLAAIENIRHLPTVSTWPEIEDATNGILENGMYLGQPVDQVIAEVDEKTRPLFERAER